MRTSAVLLASGALLLSAGIASAGPCSSEIDNLAKAFAARDAGSGPTAAGPGATTGQHPPTVVMSESDPSGRASAVAEHSGKPQHPPTAIMNRETTGSSTPEPQGERASEQHPPTAVMNQQTEGSAASPQDVQRQTQGQPTAAQQAQGQITASHDMAAAMAALERARLFDRQGSEAECLSAVGQAKLLLGAR